MKRFLLLCALFATIVIATLVVGEIIVRDVPNPYTTKYNILHSARADSTTVLILGSSHNYYGIIPDSIKGEYAVNLANVSQNFEYDTRILEEAIPLMPRLKTVIVNVSYASFWDAPFDAGSEWWYEIYYNIYMHIDKHSKISRYGFEMSKFSVFSSKIKNLLMHKPLQKCDSRGYGLDYQEPLSDDERDADGIVAAARHHNPTKKYEAYNVEWAERLLKLCKEHDFRVILITTPAWQTYRENIDAQRLSDMHKIIETLCRIYGAEYYDFMADPSFSPDDYHDGDHLTHSGASRFTKKINSLLLNAD